VPALVTLGQIRRVDLEISTGQIVEQHIEIGVEQVAPALRQMREQRLLVGQQKVMAGIQLVRLRQSKIRPQQVAHSAVAEPFAVQLPLAARRDQAIGHQDLKNLVPSRVLAACRQALGPELIQMQRTP
jgi:hypothetical protein